MSNAMHKELRELMSAGTSDFDPDPIGDTDPDVAYTEGWEAAEASECTAPQDLCPYPEGTPQHDKWDAGFADYLEDKGILV